MSAAFEIACRKLATELGEEYEDVRAASIRGIQHAESIAGYEGISAGTITREAYNIFLVTLRERRAARRKGSIISHFQGIEDFTSLLPPKES